MKGLYYLYNDGHNPFPTMKGKGLSEEEEAEVNEHLRGLGGLNMHDKGVMMDEMIHYYDGRPDIQEYIKGALDPIAKHFGIDYKVGDDFRDLITERYKDYHDLVGDKYDDDEELDSMSMNKKLKVELMSQARSKEEARAKDIAERVKIAKQKKEAEQADYDITKKTNNTLLAIIGRRYDNKELPSLIKEGALKLTKAEEQEFLYGYDAYVDYLKAYKKEVYVTKANVEKLSKFSKLFMKISEVLTDEYLDEHKPTKEELSIDYKINAIEKLVDKEQLTDKQINVLKGVALILMLTDAFFPSTKKTLVKEYENIQTEIKSDREQKRLKEEQHKAKEEQARAVKTKGKLDNEAKAEEQRRIDKEKAKAQKAKQPVSEGTKPPKESPEEIQRKEEARKRTKEGIERSKAEKELTKAQEFERNKALYSKNALIEDANREYAKRIPEGSPIVVGGHGFELFLATTGKSILGNKVTMTEDLKAIPEAERGKCIVDLVLPDRVVECKNFYNEDMDEDGYVAIQQSKLIGNDSYAIYFSRLGADSYEVSVITCNGTPVIKSKGYDVVLNAKGGIYHYNLLSDRTHINDKTMIPFNSSLGKLYMVDVGALPKTTDKVSGSEEYIPSIRIPKKAFDKYR